MNHPDILAERDEVADAIFNRMVQGLELKHLPQVAKYAHKAEVEAANTARQEELEETYPEWGGIPGVYRLHVGEFPEEF